jgi:hypothetical protein
MDQVNDSTADDPAEDFVAAFATADAVNLYFRMDLVNLAPVVCGNGVRESGEDCEADIDCLIGEECEDCDCEVSDE